jgi:tight adherence protein C
MLDKLYISLKPYIGSPETFLVYALTFAAIFIPVVFWRRDEFVDRSVPTGDWKRMPVLFKIVWRASYIFETTIGALFAKMFPRQGLRYVELAEISGLPLTGRRVFVCKVFYAVVFGAIGSSLFLLVPTVPLGIAEVAEVVAVALGWSLPSLALSSVAQRRQEEIIKALPFAIDLIGAAMRAGLEFGAAMRYYVGLGDECALRDEFARVLRETALGKPIQEGLTEMADRVRIKSFTAFAGVVSYGIAIGASIADTLKVHGAEMRRERFSMAEQKAARAPAVMIFPIAMFILPAVFLVIFVPVFLQFLQTQGR